MQYTRRAMHNVAAEIAIESPIISFDADLKNQQWQRHVKSKLTDVTPDCGMVDNIVSPDNRVNEIGEQPQRCPGHVYTRSCIPGCAKIIQFRDDKSITCRLTL